MDKLTYLFFLFTLAGCDFKSSEDYRKEANLLEEQKKFREAIVLLDRAVEKDPSNIRALMDRGVDKSFVGDYTGAIADYSKVLEIDPDNCLAFVNRGKNKKRIDDYMEAIKDFDNAISTKGGEYIYFDKVENSFVETGFEFDVEMEAIRFERGIAYSFIQNYEKSLRDFEFCIQKNYSLPDCHYWTGLIYLNTGLNQKACEHLYKAKELGDPDAEDLIRKNCK